MSVFISSTGNDDHLDLDITGLGVDSSQRVLVHCWAFMPTGTVPAGQYMVRMEDSGGGSGAQWNQALSLGDIIVAAVDSNQGTANSGQAMPNDQWVAVTGVAHPVTGGNRDIRCYIDGVLAQNSTNAATQTARTYDLLRFGTRSSNNLSTWRDGRLAELSVFTGITGAEAETLAQCLGGNGLAAETGTAANHADVLAIATPVLYHTFLNDASATIGTIVPTTAGSPTFSNAVHPTLTNPAPKGSAATMPIVAWV